MSIAAEGSMPGRSAGVRRGIRHLLAWGVHAYTALGLVLAALAGVAIVEGDPLSLHRALVYLFLAVLVDATDGTLARAVRVKEVLPGFDGRRLDDLIDFLNYTVLPLFFIWRAGLLPASQEGWLLVPLLASAYGFSQTHSKTEDGYFLGFPSYWNLIAFYGYLWHTQVTAVPGWLALGLLLLFAVLTFVPTRYLYPTQRGRLNVITNVLGGAWAMLLVVILYRLPGSPDGSDSTLPELIAMSLYFPVYYLAVSWSISWHLAQHGKRQGKGDGEVY